MPDFTVAAGVKPPSFDPLATITSLNAAKQGMLQNKLLDQTVAQTIAQRKAAQGAINPQTGGWDPDQYMRNLSASPEGAGVAPEAAAQAQQNRIQQLAQHISEQNYTQEQLKTSQMELENGGKIGQAILASGNTSKDFVAKFGDQIVPTMIRTPEGMKHWEDLKAALTDDPQANAKIIQNFVNGSMDVVKAMGDVKPTDIGGAVQMGRVNPATGSYTPTAEIPKSASPEFQQTFHKVWNPEKNQYEFISQGEMSGAGGSPDSGQPTSGGGTAPDGRYPGSARHFTAEPSPGTPEMMTASANTYLSDAAAIPELTRTLTAFDQAYDTLKKAKTGPGAEPLQNLRGIADTFGIPLPGLANKSETVAYQETDKWLSSALAQESHRLGLGTDEARRLQQSAQPGVHTVHDAAVAMIPILKGLKAMEVAAPMVAKAQGVTPQQYVEWRAQWANSVDPLAFGAALMPVTQRKALISGMSAAEKAKYAKGLQAAVDAGLFTADDLRK